MAGGSREHGQSVASKIFRILAVFSADRTRLRASEICRRTGLPFATAHRLLAELVTQGVLEHAPDGTYAIGLRLWEIAALTSEVALLRRAAMPCMHDLFAAFRGTVHLNVRAGAEGLCVEELSDLTGQPPDRLGRRFPLCSSAGGHVLLAYAGPELLDAPPACPAYQAVLSSRILRQLVAEIRRAGVAVARSQSLVSVAAPVFDAAGSVIASLELAAPAADLSRVVPAVRAAASQLSDADHVVLPPVLATAARDSGNRSVTYRCQLCYPLSGHGRDNGRTSDQTENGNARNDSTGDATPAAPPVPSPRLWGRRSHLSDAPLIGGEQNDQ
jgi:DNA-binding IclR family transcriptional regulator